jgi:hypothetical protein
VKGKLRSAGEPVIRAHRVDPLISSLACRSLRAAFGGLRLSAREVLG